MNRYRLIFTLIALILCAHAMALPSNAPRIIRVDGVITENTALKLNQQLSNWKNQDPLPAGLIVLLDSTGGDGEAAMKMGRLLRTKKAQVFVTGKCESACVFVLAGGVVRAANPGDIGVHAGRLTISNPDGKVLKEVDSTKSLNGSFRLTSFNSEAHQYFNQIGFGSGFLDVMLSHRTVETYKLSEYELRKFSVIGFENQYLNERAKFFENLKGREHLNRVELFNRTLSIPSACKAQANDDEAFINCYTDVLYGQQ